MMILALYTGKKLISSIRNPTNLLNKKTNPTEKMGKGYRQDIDKIHTGKYKRFFNTCKMFSLTYNIKRN